MLVQALKKQTQIRSAETVSTGFYSLFGGATTKSGVAVSNNSALTLSAFYNGINILCNDYAKLPKNVIQVVNGSREYLTNHPVQYLIHDKPNKYMNAFDFDSIMLRSAILKGNGYAIKKYNEFTGEITALDFVNQSKTPVSVFKTEDGLFYSIAGKIYPSEDILHFKSLFSDDGLTGIGVVTFAARSLGVALSSQEFAEEYYANKGIGLGVVTSSKDMEPEAKSRYSKALSDSLTSKSKGKFGVAVLDQMGTFQHIKLTPQESLFLETNKHAVEEVARWLNIPVYKLKITENQNNSNMENQSISHVSDSILPFAIKMSQEYNSKLFTPAERAAGIKVKFNINSLLQADKKTQAEWYMKMIYSGVMTRNEVRALEDLNALEGLDEPLTPVNMQTMEQLQKSLNSTGNE